jgi:hypothetical protein
MKRVSGAVTGVRLEGLAPNQAVEVRVIFMMHYCQEIYCLFIIDKAE